MAEEKKIATQSFEDGINTVIAPELLPNTFSRYNLNLNILSQGAGNVGKGTNVLGNTQIPFELPEGTNTCIGTALDEENNKFYFFIHNSNKFHGIYQYDGLTKKVIRLLENMTDTGNIDILGFDLDYLILHANVVKGSLYWVDGLNPARKTNIAKLLDKSATGYGGLIVASYINAYKQTSAYAPTVAYNSDTTKPFNKIYGALRKFCIRYIYDDGEVSNWSDFSEVPLPSYESFTGINSIPTDNNVIDITFNTGDRTVVKVQIAMLATNEELVDATLPWGIAATLDKSKLGVSDNSEYTYKFYNDIATLPTEQEKIIRPNSFLPKRPLAQEFVKNALVYANVYEGFDNVVIDVDVEVTYSDLFLEDGTENEFNEPEFLFELPPDSGDYVSKFETIWNVDNIEGILLTADAPSRFNIHKITVGNDVKKGNKFVLQISNGATDNWTFTVIATNTDSAATIANKFKTWLILTGRIFRKTEELPDTNIYENDVDGDGNVSFSYIMRSYKDENYLFGSTSVEPVQFDSLKDTGQSVRNIKMGSSIKLGIMYEDFDGRKSLVYTNDALITNINTANEMEGIKASTITVTINHRPPLWARRYQIVRSPDLVYGDYIQMLIQKVVVVNEDEDTQDYLDLLVGSLDTYKKIHPNSPLSYGFKEGDRIRLLMNTDTETYYDFFETEIIAYNQTVTYRERSNVVTDGTNIVTVAAASDDNIGKFMVIEGSERLITDAPSATTYLLDSEIGSAVADDTYLFYDLVDRRGSIRIRKPQGVTIADNSTVEIFTPAAVQNALSSIQFNEFQKKFEIINAGTEGAYHAGSTQDQSASQPAIVKIGEGTAYVRNRELPVNNAFPGTQLVIQVIEDASYSDFYESELNDNGRLNIEDDGTGEKHFGSRMRFSNNFIEDTKINGLNDFDNTDREDYNDQYGDIKLIKFDENLLYTFKQLKNAYVPVDARITQDNSGVVLNVGSAKLLNPIQYFPQDGGIGDNPESYSSNGTHKYLVSANTGTIVRIGGNGEEPISKTYFLDNEVRRVLAEALTNKARIFGGFDKKNGGYIVTIEGYQHYIYFDGFNGWIVLNDAIPEGTTFEIVTPPTNGDAILTGNEIDYTPDADYVGNDSFTYRAFLDGVWSSPRKVCLTINEVPNATTWRPIDPYCVLDEYGLQTGYRGWENLEEYYIFDNTSTGNIITNVITDPRYVAPVYDPINCVPEPPDPEPDPFSFTPVVNAFLNTPYISNTQTLTGFNVPLAISVANGEYRKNGGAWTSVAGTVVEGDIVEVRQTSSPDQETLTTATLTVGAQSADYDVTTGNFTIACGTEGEYEGGQTFPTEITVTLGSGLGDVTLTYEAYGVPDKFEVWFNGVKVIDTGYRGDIAEQANLDNALYDRGLPSEPITSPGDGTASFTKSDPFPTAIVKIYGPLPDTIWNFTLGCPV